jgi:hypothetical protein
MRNLDRVLAMRATQVHGGPGAKLAACGLAHGSALGASAQAAEGAYASLVPVYANLSDGENQGQQKAARGPRWRVGLMLARRASEGGLWFKVAKVTA